MPSLIWDFIFIKLRVDQTMRLQECDVLVVEHVNLWVSSDRIM